MPRGLWEDEFYMTQSILLVIIVIGTIALITCRSGVGILLGEVNIYDKEMTECYRGVAIILIVVQHCAGELGTNIFTPFGGIGVAVFLLLSGFGLTESFSKRGMRGFLKSKLWRVWVPFLLFYTGIYLLYDKHNYKNLFLNICSIRQDDYWYVHYMLRCYLVFWVAFKFFYKYRWYLLVAFAIYTFFCMDSIRAEQCLSFPIGVHLSEKKEKVPFALKKKICTTNGNILYYRVSLISNQAVARSEGFMWYTILLSSRIWHKITFGNFCYDYSLVVTP